MKDYYSILGLTKDAQPADIKKAYRKLAQKYHPDRNPDDAQALNMFKEANEANEVLSDPNKRRQYDGMRRGGFNGDIRDLFESVFGGASSGFSGGFGGFATGRAHKQNTRRRPVTPGDAIINFEVSLDELESGSAARNFNITKHVSCHDCNGVGGDSVSVCNACDGNGTITQEMTQGTMRFQVSSPCSHCNATGEELVNPCAPCSGTGVLEEQHSYSVHIESKII